MSPGEYEQLLHDAEVRLARLKSLYEQYFQGIEKLEPAIPRKELERVLDILRKNQPRNTALRFRTQMLIAKYGTYVTYWQRIARQIEEGTYRRDVVRAQQRRQRDEARKRRAKDDDEAETPGAWELDVDVDEVEDLKNFSFDDSDVDAILGALGPATREPSVPPPAPRRLSPFGSSIPPRPSPAASDALRPAPLPASAPLPAPAPAITPKPATATFAKPVSATFGKPGTATFAKPAAAPSASAPTPPTPPGSAPRAIPQPPPRPPVAAARPPVVPPPPRDGLDDANMRRLYDRYVEARRRNNERVDNVRYETLAQSVEQMLPKLREKHGDRKIDFDIVVQNGKVGLKPKVG
ncbi:MXAN_5187 C-terminal domain-containing protein [Sandaracinus amylolyticus]|uniref:MXAN_5187 C-terminal domain-containing protein n=1 Tax=Sandaracinus amylolyticus TaxID=927083 RepID=UPI001F469EB4|nr:MXAN_5187 C-terminal domain-containing protein [Sandaracinus amylolyticus]UJR78296.1 Hypothetical protein I5071_3230 [Sandaracinus amylolyticus]